MRKEKEKLWVLGVGRTNLLFSRGLSTLGPPMLGWEPMQGVKTEAKITASCVKLQQWRVQSEIGDIYGRLGHMKTAAEVLQSCVASADASFEASHALRLHVLALIAKHNAIVGEGETPADPSELITRWGAGDHPWDWEVQRGNDHALLCLVLCALCLCS
jgi:hypothetical protein